METCTLCRSTEERRSFYTSTQRTIPPVARSRLAAIQAYDVWQEKKNYGKTYMGVVRTTYLIDEKGKIVKAFDKVKAADNPEQMLGELG